MSDKFMIETEFTPNPNSLKFNMECEITDGRTAFFSSSKEASSSPLAEKIFSIENIREVFIGKNFVTVTRDPEIQTWAKIISSVTEICQNHLAAGEPVLGEASSAHADTSGGEVEQKIIQILDERIRPAVQRDGGDILFESFKDGVVRLHLRGACSSCPSSVMTLKAGVESMLRELIPEVKEVIQA